MSRRHLGGMSHTHRRCRTPPSITVRIKPSGGRGVPVRGGPLTRGVGGLPAETFSSRATATQTLVIQRREMAAYFRLLDDEVIQDFLWMDCCCKLSDKYLLAMVFVYFIRSRFSLAEYTRRNFFIGLYLANTMEEDEEESKYEIFPWALGKNWKKQFPYFLRQRDKLWARIKYRAAVSRTCCEKVMAIVPSHVTWNRVRSERHSGALRQYGDRDKVWVPRGPSASPLPCALCARSAASHQSPDLSSPSRLASAQTPDPAKHPFPLMSLLCHERTPSRASQTRHQGEHSCRCCAEECLNGERYDTSMDWINEE